MPRRKEDWICDVCRRPACLGGCYYTPARVRGKLADLPNDAARATDPNSYTKKSKIEGNPEEGNWAVRADLQRALAHVKGAVPNGPTIEQVVVLAYVGVPVAGRAGRWAGVSDSGIARLLHLDERTVAGYRQLGLRMMVQKLNPEYRWKEGE